MRSLSRLIGLIATLVAPALMSAQTYPKAADPRSNLKPGRFDAGTAASNMRLVSFSPKPAQFDTVRGLTFINLLLNAVFFGVWFACLWLLLRFQWPHALGLAVPLWATFVLIIVPMLITRSGG